MKKLILTERRNPDTVNIDLLSSYEAVTLINNEDKKVALAVEKELLNIAKAVDIISEKFFEGGRLIYFGAGTSGRLGVLDASECPPTFGADPEMVKGYIAGGDYALRNAVEGAEDSFEEGLKDFENSKATSHDIVVGISASGNANYVKAVMKAAQEKKIKTIAIVCNKNALIKEFSDIFIAVEVGEEVITGSTRMKAGTAQKMVLNMLTTASMIKFGKTYENYMIDVKSTNEKLKNRAARIVSELACVEYEKAKEVLLNNNYNVKLSIIMLKKGVALERAQELLEKNKGILRKII
ncbi:MAG: N-acetylmuramic acid 6-phosphate etherase [Candidatus Gastranaerophilaceae bacterium]|jgi:N-acetylmuramic acid 6-phosphate etherase